MIEPTQYESVTVVVVDGGPTHAALQYRGAFGLKEVMLFCESEPRVAVSGAWGVYDDRFRGNGRCARSGCQKEFMSRDLFDTPS